MRVEPESSLIFSTLAGALAVAAGATAGFVLPQGLCVTLGVFLIIRICWLDDNVTNDLANGRALPPSYTAAFRKRKRLGTLIFGAAPAADPPSAAILATRLRAEARFWSAFVLGGASVLVALELPFGSVPSALLAVWLFLWALRRADRLAMTLRNLEAGRAETPRDTRAASRPGIRR